MPSSPDRLSHPRSLLAAARMERAPYKGSHCGWAARLLPLLLVASLGGSRALAAEGPRTPGKCRLAGVWVNELGSRMVISAADVKGRFTGSYLTGVAASDNPIEKSFLQGVQHRGAQPTFGLAVHWAFSDSTTVFVGQCFVAADGKEVLQTAWLLREAVNSQAEDWKATRVGQNIFLRLK